MAATTNTELPVLVAGGGIGGLAAVLALVRRGFSVKVMEPSPESARSPPAKPSGSVSATPTP